MNRNLNLIVNVFFLISGAGMGIFGYRFFLFSSNQTSAQVSPAAREERNTGVSAPEISRLGQLIVLDAVFNSQDGAKKISSLGELIILDGLFGHPDQRNCQRTTSELGELIVLQGVFGNSSSTASRLERLITLEGLFANAGSCQFAP